MSIVRLLPTQLSIRMEGKKMSGLKQKLIEQITQLNRSAQAEFLSEFNEAELQQYLRNLQDVWEDFERQFAEPADEIQHEIEQRRNTRQEELEPTLLIA